MSAIEAARAMRADDIALSAALAGASMRTRLAVNALLAEPLTDADLTVDLTMLSRHVEAIDYNAEQPLTPSTRLALAAHLRAWSGRAAHSMFANERMMTRCNTPT